MWEDSDMIEGNITAVEAFAALRTMKNDKSPGSDGFTAECYKVFGMILEPSWCVLLIMASQKKKCQ